MPLLLLLLFRVLSTISLSSPSDPDDKKSSNVITKHTTNDGVSAPRRSSAVLNPTSVSSSISERNLPNEMPTKIPSFGTTPFRSTVLELTSRFTTPTAVEAPSSVAKAAPLPSGGEPSSHLASSPYTPISPQWNASTPPAQSATELVHPPTPPTSDRTPRLPLLNVAAERSPTPSSMASNPHHTLLTVPPKTQTFPLTNVSKAKQQSATAQPPQQASHPLLANTTLRSPTPSDSHSASTLASFSSRSSTAYKSLVKPRNTTTTELTTANDEQVSESRTNAQQELTSFRILYMGDGETRRKIRTRPPKEKKSDKEILSPPIFTGFLVIGALVFVVVLILIAITIRRQRLRQKEEMEKKKPVIAKKPRKMESANIYAKKFTHGGALVLDQKLKGPVRHACDDQKTVSIHSLTFDPQLNEIVDIGSNVDVLNVSQNTTYEGGTIAEGEKKRRSTMQKLTGEEKTPASTTSTSKRRSTMQKLTGEEKTPASTTSTSLAAGKTLNKPLTEKSISQPPPAAAQGAKGLSKSGANAKPSKVSKSVNRP